MKHTVVFLLLAGSMVPGAFAQTLPAPGTGSGSGSTGTSGRIGSGTSGGLGQPPTTGFPATGTTNNSQPGTSTPIFLAGKVVMSDGTPAPGGLSIRRSCGATSRTVAYTDSKGHFSFQWGDYNGIVPDASDDGSGFSRTGVSPRGIGGTMNGPNSLENCELRVDAPGFQSDVIRLNDHRALDNPDIGTIVMRRLANVEGTSVSATALAAPGEAKKAYERGLQSAAKGKSADAQKSFEKAVAVYPKYANAWLDLGRERLKSGAEAAAREAFLKALEADDKLVGADAELGMMAARAKNWKDAAQYLDATMRLDAIDYPQLRFADAVAEYNVQNYDGAERNVREALKNDPRHSDPQQDQLLGVLLLRKGDLAGGVEELRTYLKLAPAAPDADKVKSEIAQVEGALAARAKSDPPAPAH